MNGGCGMGSLDCRQPGSLEHRVGWAEPSVLLREAALCPQEVQSLNHDLPIKSPIVSSNESFSDALCKQIEYLSRSQELGGHLREQAMALKSRQ